jgi:hypothetical protein
MAIAKSAKTKRGASPTNNSLQRTGAARIALLIAILFLIALAALAAPQDRDHDRDRDRDRDRIHVSHERTAQDFGGGSGGRPSPDAICEEGFVAVGFHVQTGEYFNQAWLDCAHLRPDGWAGDDLRMTEKTSSPGGHDVFDARCPEGRVLVGLRGRTGASIDEAAGMCSSAREVMERPDHPRVEFAAPIRRPHAEGRPAEARCPSGSVVTGFRSTSGSHMDHLWIVCSELRRER